MFGQKKVGRESERVFDWLIVKRACAWCELFDLQKRAGVYRWFCSWKFVTWWICGQIPALFLILCTSSDCGRWYLLAMQGYLTVVLSIIRNNVSTGKFLVLQ